ncbi:hypothetical protein O181_063322 [Austropuccinia psidii MF-1]|uniref:Uncharacterized protein n=1 Tax=Austropuccinia psidii MF-1 TaxID=1389203 RepID=A0A9Q3ETU0_9BASI|nr:hypothetical protein [Austropuccinia psidii MF-1]
MSSTAVFILGIISLSISVLATTKLSKRRSTAHPEVPKPLLLPWLASVEHLEPRFPPRHPANSPLIITIHSTRPPLDHYPCRSLSSSFSKVKHDSLPSYFDQPSIALPSYQGKLSLRKNTLGPASPVKPLPQVPTTRDDKASLNSFSQLDGESENNNSPHRIPSQLFFDDFKCDLSSSTLSTWKSQSLGDRHSLFENRNSFSSVASSVESEPADLSFGVEKFQKLEVVLGSGPRQQAQYGILCTSPRSQQKAPVLTPLKGSYLKKEDAQGSQTMEENDSFHYPPCVHSPALDSHTKSIEN